MAKTYKVFNCLNDVSPTSLYRILSKLLIGLFTTLMSKKLAVVDDELLSFTVYSCSIELTHLISPLSSNLVSILKVFLLIRYKVVNFELLSSLVVVT